MAQKFGKTWWGEQWLNSLNNIDYDNRLPRGASYARKGAVTKITINENQIHAKVVGSRTKPYNVTIVLPPFFDPQLSDFIDALAEKPVIISKLLNRELDPEVLAIAEKHELKVFPKQWTDFKMQCTCPDWAVPCKHLAAVIYKVSSEIDNNPFLAFHLHRVDLIKEMNERGMLVTEKSLTIPKLKDLYFERKRTNKQDFNSENAYRKLAYSTIPDLHLSLISLLSDNPVFYTGRGNFKDKYQVPLSRSVRNAKKVLKAKINLQKVLQNTQDEEQHINTHSTEKVSIDESYETKLYINNEDFSFSKFAAQLAKIPAGKTVDYQPSTAFLYSVLQLALHLLGNGAVVPQIVQRPDKQFAVRWLPAMLSKEVRSLMQRLTEMLPPDIFFWKENGREKSINKDTAINLVSVFITELISIFEEKDKDDVFLNLFFRKQAYPFRQPGEEALSGGIQVWLQKYYLTQGNCRFQVVVEETPDDQFLVNINAIKSEEPLAAPVSLCDLLTLEDYSTWRFEVLQSITQLSGLIAGLDEHINLKGAKPITMDNAAFTPFLLDMLPTIRLFDIDVLLPKSLEGILKPKPSLKLKKKQGKSFLQLDKLFEFDWQVAVGDTVMDEQDFKKLMKNADGLIKYKSKYIYVNREELEKLYKHFSNDKSLSSLQLLRTALSGEYYGARIVLTDEVKELIRQLSEVQEIPLPKHLKASLRPYQHRGYSWMFRNSKIGFGSVIADDMGLGKTLQVITTLLKYKEDGLLETRKALVIAPTGLLTNWQAEVEKFAPILKTHLFHGSNRKIDKDFDILLTSYGIARTEATRLKKMPWQSLIIDEAQNIKNVETRQAKAIKSIGADNFIAMSGTPVENRLSELWSIIDYSNRGFLGSSKEFAESYANPIETYNDETVAEKLKKVTAPFMIRRLKTDKAIISDLPDKIEMDCFATLAKEQAGLYEKTLEEALKEIEAIDASDKKGLFVRQGLVLQMILALKQICNHPTQFLKNKELDASLSGKLTLLFDKLDSIVESQEKVLLFTQFTEMGKLLQHFITERYNEEPLFYHGGCNLKERKRMVDSFQNNRADKIFILSLKAAGTGLNLTAARHVIHYDLWWNPAVETQATDRAYRIGQKNNVMVHRFITKNTFEERINELILSKKALAEMTVATGENWIGNLSNKELKELFSVN